MQESKLFRMPLIAKFLAVFCGLSFSSAVLSAEAPQVSLKTNMGEIVLELDQDKAPKSVANFMQYVKSGHYKGTIFHRVIDGFMIQGGGFDAKMVQKKTKPPVMNEGKNGLHNVPYSVAMARTNDPNSATSQFFINVADNASLDYPGRDGYGYAVFGRVIKGQDVVDKIKGVVTDTRGPFSDVPVKPVLIESATVLTKRISVPAAAPELAPQVPAPAPALQPAQ